MSRRDFNFVKVGETYQYKEESVIGNVEIIKDNSTPEWWEFEVLLKSCNYKEYEGDTFTLGRSKDLEGVYSGMWQLFENPEYVEL